jgi:DNA-directed RNA polymerase specialized sigma subunit
MNKDDCEECLKYRYCNEPCLYIDVMRGLGTETVRLREVLAPPDGRECEDYKKVLIEIQEAKEARNSKYIEKIRLLRGRRKIIAALIHAEVSMEEIAEMLRLTVRRVYQIIKGE